MSNLQPIWCLKIDFQKVDQHALYHKKNNLEIFSFKEMFWAPFIIMDTEHG